MAQHAAREMLERLVFVVGWDVCLWDYGTRGLFCGGQWDYGTAHSVLWKAITCRSAVSRLVSSPVFSKLRARLMSGM
jgi:hypothetical protein